MGARILVVEDDESVSYPLRIFLEHSGFEVDLAADQARAEDLLQRERYAVVLTDLRLRGAQGREGLDLLARVRATSPGTRTILLTAHSGEGLGREGLLGDTDLLIRKPQPLPAILADIRRLLGVPPA